jgi:hypothetical protein
MKFCLNYASNLNKKSHKDILAEKESQILSSLCLSQDHKQKVPPGNSVLIMPEQDPEQEVPQRYFGGDGVSNSVFMMLVTGS